LDANAGFPFGARAWAPQRLYEPIGIIDVASITRVELKESRENGFRIHIADRGYISVVAPSKLALTEWYGERVVQLKHLQ